ncbi:MAG: TIGR01548 family HAD-type hydrolase [Symploca sp. SIO1B1]|nr:TIGR01548 family HAD-type hydrolase [Symploca sp. SIO1C2]NES00707.1 TIGR01548 family HAD-type hydrolase [Symploca sp. SIO1B1]
MTNDYGKAIVVFDIDGVVRDVSGSYRRAVADTVEHFTDGAYRPEPIDIDQLKSEGIWNNDWQASQELIYRYFETKGLEGVPQKREEIALDYDTLVAFFQSRYRGTETELTGYICNEPLLMAASYLESLTAAAIPWGFFSGATREEAEYALIRRLGIEQPVLIAMEDAPGKPDPTGLFAVVDQLKQRHQIKVELPVIYVGDTVADIYTVNQARSLQPEGTWIGVGVLPPHVQETSERSEAYRQSLQQAGASLVFSNVEQLTPEEILSF